MEECIDSAINQTHHDIEIIAVDDGSTDRSPDILKKYSNKIKIITKENGGLSSALNAGIKAATGEWVKTLDSDDVLYPNAIEELIAEAKNLQNKKNTILYGNFDFINSEGKIVDHVVEQNYDELDAFDFNVMILDHHVGNGLTVLYHKSAIDEYGMFDEKIDYHEDYELRMRYCILHNCRMQLIPKTLGKYRIHQGQMTKGNIKRTVEQGDKMRKSVLDKLNSVEREKYEIALKQYKKNRPMRVKILHFLRFNIIPILPTYFAIKLVLAYWHMKKRKNS